MSHASHFIAGQWQPGKGPRLNKFSPLDQQILWQGNSASAEDVSASTRAARRAFYDWSHLTVTERIDIVNRFAKLLAENKDSLATVISQETSKPLWETRTEVQAMIGKATISQDAYHRRTGETESALPDGKALLRHKPHGVMAVFGPYNFPGHLPNGHIIPALIAGNTLVFKPSEMTPATAELTVKLWQQAGLPAGVLNLVQGDKETGAALLENKEIDGVLFTGSASAGFHFHRVLAGRPEKILALEMGGNNALIADSYDDVDAAVNLIIQSAFISAGQRCTCARRLLVKQGDAGDALLARLVEISERIVVGHWNADPQPFMGGVISLRAANAMLKAQEHLLTLGGKSLLMLKQPDANATLLSPGIIEMTGIDAPDEEYFGPLLSVIRYQSFDEALRIANHTRYGLAVGLIARDEGLFNRLTDEARAGIVNWNKPLTGASSNAPFGGVGASGNHRASAFYAADYFAWPMASLTSPLLSLPATPSPGLPF
jgi:succinylglutamic semialdehyde dehydrogenase